MNAEIKQQWVSALRSGTYKQAQGSLRKGDCYCVLGVLCDIYAKEKNLEWQKTSDFSDEAIMSFMGLSGATPLEVDDWAGLKANAQELRSAVAELNDSGVPFDKIADIIEKEF